MFGSDARTNFCCDLYPPSFERHIQEVLNHDDLGGLPRYLEVSPEQKRKTVAVDWVLN